MDTRSAKQVIVIGGGAAGIIFCKYAQDKNLDVLLLEKESEIGGLWRKLPTWQDLQIRPLDWTLNGLPIKGALQADVVKNIESWVDRYQLRPYILVNHPVERVRREGTLWRVTTPQGEYTARNLVLATGMQNGPLLPRVERLNPTVHEFHSSTFRDPSSLKGKRVVVVGGGASAYDLLDLALENQAATIHWVYRSTRWMIPSLQPKTAKPALRVLAFQQMWQAPETIQKLTQEALESKYRHFKLEAILPREPYDYRRQQLIPGRPLMIRHFAQLQRHVGELRRIEGNRFFVSNGDSGEADVILYGTGYRIHLEYLGLPELSPLQRTDQLCQRAGSMMRSLDYENLFFLGPALPDQTSTSTPFCSAVTAKSIIAHIQGKIEIPKTPLPHSIHYWDLLRLFAGFDRQNYSRFWRLKYKLLAWWYLKRLDRILGV